MKVMTTVADILGSLIGRVIIGASYTIGGYFGLWLIGVLR